MIDLKRNLFKIDARAQKDEEKVFMRTAWEGLSGGFISISRYAIIKYYKLTIIIVFLSF
ncbi:hypothetical protein STPL106120_04540 [Streptococcus pluranimalium]|uniref:hypothetical protein n=1 Tax=Streptococcus pluranimalium TaxID=82348 RepID=UPI0039EC6B61